MLRLLELICKQSFNFLSGAAEEGLGTFFETKGYELLETETPILTGEIPSVWGFGYGSIIGDYQQHIRTSHLLLRAEKWASLAEILLDKLYPMDGLR
jgi:hypothetical protein